MLKIITLVGTRPEVIRLSRIIYKLDQVSENILIHTGQNYDFELNQIFFDDLQIRKPNYFLNAAGETSIQTISNILIAIEKIIDEIKPDAFLVLGDTNSALAAIVAKRKKCSYFILEAGNRCLITECLKKLQKIG